MIDLNRTKCILIILLSLVFCLVGKGSWSQLFRWQSEYKDLLKAIDIAKNTSLSTSYQVGPKGIDKVKLLLKKNQGNSLIVTINLPQKALVTKDEKNSGMIPSKVNWTIIIRDHNFDGTPDDYITEPKEKFIYAGKAGLTEDGFIKIRNAPEDMSIVALWNIAIEYSINHFLHEFDSAIPRKPIK